MIKNSKFIPTVILALLTMTLTAFAADKPIVELLTGATRGISLIKSKTAPAWQKTLVFEKDGKHKVSLRIEFQVENPARFASLTLKRPSHIENITLNGKPVKKPLKGMIYESIPGIPTSLLKRGPNELILSWTQQVKEKRDKKNKKVTFSPTKIDPSTTKISLQGLTPAALSFQTGPILGYAGETFFTVTCRINIPAEVVLEVNNKQYISKKGLMHSLKAEGLTANTAYTYTLKARLASQGDTLATAGPHTMRTLPNDDKFTFAILGDTRSNPKDWKRVADAVVKAKPVFSVLVGDMVGDGRRDKEWDEQHIGPAAEYFATIPYYPVIGNHECNCTLFPYLFPTPGGKNWSQQIGPVLVIGIDGLMDWSADSELTRKLEKTLASSKAKFIFLCTHYPAWTSGAHGRLGKDGRPSEKSIKNGQDVLLPLLKKYHATAMFAGHDHFYERSETPSGIPVIITGGAGAPLRDKAKAAKKQNPYSKVYAKKHHYCLLRVDGGSCTMKVLTPEGKEIDTRTWSARK